ncbi:MAG TPA: hypothetical protein VLM38_00010 [Blastocatellia bacterium]|nr:hypothetical protein [Blastocatellia bacterium]
MSDACAGAPLTAESSGEPGTLHNKSQGADLVTVLPANYVYRWIHLILIYFDLQHKNPYPELFQRFNQIYNERLSPYDYREPCYRYLILIPTVEELDMNAFNGALTRPFEKPASVKDTDELLVQTFRELDASAADQLRAGSLETQRLHREIERLHTRIAQLEEAPGFEKRIRRVLSRIRRFVKVTQRQV